MQSSRDLPWTLTRDGASVQTAWGTAGACPNGARLTEEQNDAAVSCSDSGAICHRGTEWVTLTGTDGIIRGAGGDPRGPGLGRGCDK